jgi:hypothetical protein
MKGRIMVLDAYATIRAKVEITSEALSRVSFALGDFLNHVTIDSICTDTENGGANEEYRSDLLSDLRKIEVYCTDGYEACRRLLRSSPFPEQAAERILTGIYHKCIESFFSPKKDAWYEDSRAAYSGEASVHFYHEVAEPLKVLMADLENEFLPIRETLQFYESNVHP